MHVVEPVGQLPGTLTQPEAPADPPTSPHLVAERPETPPAADRTFDVLGVRITDVTRSRAVQLISQMLEGDDGVTRAVFFVNAHTLNLAAADEQYREVLNSADYVFGDGTGVRWAARLQGIQVRDNLAGTDLTPLVFQRLAGNGYRYFLLGGTESTIRRAAEHAACSFYGWTLAGYHHGYIHDPELSATVIRQINQARPHLLLVGMGNPLQERWIVQHRRQLKVLLCMAVGGLFGYWSGELTRSPRWLRRLGAEWLGILCQQPHKARRYLLGNPLFLWRICREHLRRPARVNLARWSAKKLARQATVLASAALELPARRSSACLARLRVLTYHRCGFARRDPFCVSPDEFARQMRFLAENNLAISLEELEDILARRKPLRDGAVMVTADDGLRSVLTEMLPVWRHYRIPAVVFVSPALVPERNANPCRRQRPDADAREPWTTEPYMTWDELAELHRCGVAIGSHGLTHRSLGRLGPEELAAEVCQSRDILQSRLACKVAAFAYPYGTRADFSPAAAKALSQAGYTIAFTSQHGAIGLGAEPLELPRIKIESGEGMWMFRSIVAGGLDAWGLVDRWLWPWQQRR
jgi:N-acetylglucosaminyldiphosphoundecaprenol N-acetyl-beta-D-mannosaminyltransferase